MDIIYKKLLKEIIRSNNSELPSGREGMPNTKSKFALNATYPISELNFNICTGKEVNFQNITSELLWFMKGFTNVNWLNRRNNYIWNEDAYNYYTKLIKNFGDREMRNTILSFKDFNKLLKDGISLDNIDSLPHIALKNQCDKLRTNNQIDYFLGDCGKQYGWLWRDNDNVDQLMNLIIQLKQNPFSRRHVLSAWNVRTLNEMALPACHSMSIFKVEQNKSGDNFLNCHLTQRSGDMFLGIPYNVSSYTLLTIMIARVLKYETGDFNHIIVDGHIYIDHMDAVKDYIESPIEKYPLLKFSDKYLEYESYVVKALNNCLDDPKILHTTINNWINNIDFEDIKLLGYIPTKKIKAKLHTGKR